MTKNPVSSSVKVKPKKSARTPTIAKSLRDKEKKMHDEYLSNLHSCPMDMPRAIYFSSTGDDVEEMRKKMMRSLIDPKTFDYFLESPFGKYLLEGIQEEEKVEKRGITKVSEFIRAENTYVQAKKKAKFEAALHINSAQ